VLSGVPIGFAYLIGNTVLGAAFLALGAWLVRRSSRTRRDDLAMTPA
jgi:hypothetical protein